MRSVSVVCDNHTERPAVATHYVAPVALGVRGIGFGIAPATGRYVDLCGECAAVLGWAAPTPAPAPEPEPDGDPANDAQRRLIFARCGEIGIDEDERHALLERVTGSPSMRDLLSKDVDRVVSELALVEASRVKEASGA